MNTKGLFVILGIAAVYAITQGTRLLNRITYQVINTKFKTKNLTEVVIESNIKLINDSTKTFNIEGFTGGLYYKQMKISEVNTPVGAGFTLGAKSTADISLLFTIDPSLFFAQLATTIGTGAGDIIVQGILKTDKAQIPVYYKPNLLPA